MDLIFEGIKKAFWLLITFDPEVMGITLLSLEVSGTATLISLLDRDIDRVDGGPLQVSREKDCRKPHQHRHGPSAGGGRSLRHDFALEEWPSWFFWNSLHTYGHDHCPDDHRYSDCDGHHPGCHSTTSAKTSTSNSGSWGNPAADGLDSDQGGQAPPAGCGDGRIWWCDLRSRGLHHGRWKYQGLFPGVDHCDGHGDEPGKLRYRHCPGHHPPLACLFHQSRSSPRYSREKDRDKEASADCEKAEKGVKKQDKKMTDSKR